MFYTEGSKLPLSTKNRARKAIVLKSEVSEKMPSIATKVDVILSAWLQFIRLEDLSNAKVPLKDAKEQGVRLIGNSLVLDETLFATLQESTASSSSEKQAPWVLSFPQIFKVEQNQTQLCPLFSLDVTDIFKGSYQAEGWNVETFKMAEAGENLANFLNLDDEKLEQLNVKDGLRRFLEDTFGFGFDTLENWMQQVDISKYKIKRQPYLFQFKGSGFSYNLKRDLKEIREAETKQWLELGHPAYEYLFGSPKPFTNEISYLGAFLTHPPTDSQLKAIKHSQTEPLTAVQGPPGSGKTTLILHLIAQQVVDRALSLIETGEDKNNLTVISSTNNKAVDNVIERLNDDLPECFFYLNGGSKPVIDRAGGAKEQIQKALEYLKSTEFDQNEHTLLAGQISVLKRRFVRQEQDYREKVRDRKTDLICRPEVEEELRSIRQTLALNRTAREQLGLRSERLAHFDRLPESAYRQIQLQFRIVTPQLPDRTPPWWTRWIYWLLGRTERQILAKMIERCHDAISQTLGTAFEIEPPYDRHSLNQQHQKVDERLDKLQELRTVRDDLENRLGEQLKLEREQQDKQEELSAIVQRLSTEIEDYYNTFHTRYHEQHQKLFERSREYLAQEALRRKPEIEAALRLYLKALPGQGPKTTKRMENNLDEHLKALSLVFPVITCTLQSIKNMLPWTQQCADRVIIDEAGMIPLHQTFPLLVRTRKAIVVGDPLQIEPIINQTDQTLERYDQECFLQQGLTQEDIYRYSPSETDTATTYHRAAGATGEDTDQGQGIRLLEHYRCQPSIITFCDRISNYGLVVKRSPEASRIGSNLVAYHVDGSMTDSVNQDEVKAVDKVIRHLIEYGYSPQDIGVISPYRLQAEALRNTLAKRFSGLECGTVHTFQGSQRQVIILSTRVCQRQDNVTWINQRSNLLNVAVSRAEDLFILVGNLHRLEEAGSHTGHLVKHIREQGVILEYKAPVAIAAEYRLSPDIEWIHDCDHLNILTEAVRDAEQDLYIITPEIRGQAAQEFNQKIVAALKRGINVTVLYGSANRRDSEETPDESRLKSLFNKHKGARVFHLKEQGQSTNERILICDSKFAVVGSWNWLSHVYLSTCQKEQVTAEVQITQETSVRITDFMTIQSKIEDILELIKTLT